MSRADKARAFFLEGYNCAQAVAVAFADLMGMSEAQAALMTSGFGGGMGRLREVCGSVSGAVFVLSNLYGYSEPKDFEGKKRLYGEIQTVAGEFAARNGSVVCRELLGIKTPGADSPIPEQRTAAYYRKRPCPDLIWDSADILEKYIANRKTS